MLKRQHGVLNLYWVAIASAGLALLAMAALYSMRYERNLFAEGWAKTVQLVGASPAADVADAARKAIAGTDPARGDGAMRKCVIAGKTVISNAECAASNATSKVIEIHDTKGFEAPKAPPVAAAAPAADSTTDKLIEKQLR
jgi:hypothetical protein